MQESDACLPVGRLPSSAGQARGIIVAVRLYAMRMMARCRIELM